MGLLSLPNDVLDDIMLSRFLMMCDSKSGASTLVRLAATCRFFGSVQATQVIAEREVVHISRANAYSKIWCQRLGVRADRHTNRHTNVGRELSELVLRESFTIALSADKDLDMRFRLWCAQEDLAECHLPDGFFATPCVSFLGVKDIFEWHCGIPGAPGTPREGCVFPLRVVVQPKAGFWPRSFAEVGKFSLPPGFLHTSVYPSGRISVPPSSFDDQWQWQVPEDLKHIQVPAAFGWLVFVYDFLRHHGNVLDPCQAHAYEMWNRDPSGAMYNRFVLEQSQQYRGTGAAVLPRATASMHCPVGAVTNLPY